MGPQVPRLVIRLALLALVLLLPGAAASLPYQGPGQNGFVPLGAGETGLVVPDAVADNRTRVVLDNVPASICRIVLDSNATYQIARLDWEPSIDGNNTTARVYAPEGERDVRWRIAAHWRTDIKGDCTIEQTPTKTIYHDPRGRAFIDLKLVERRPFFTTMGNETVRIELVVHNNGTIADRVDGRLELRQTGWNVSGATPVLGVPVGPLENVTFGFDLHVPATAFPRVNVFTLDFDARDSPWRDTATVFIDVKPRDPPDPVDLEEMFAPGPTAAVATPVAEAETSPVSLSGALVLLVGAVAVAHRVRRQRQ